MDIHRQLEDCFYRGRQSFVTQSTQTVDIFRQREEFVNRNRRSFVTQSTHTMEIRQQTEKFVSRDLQPFVTPLQHTMGIRRQQEVLPDDCKNQRSETPPPHTMDISRQQEELTDDCKNQRSETPSSGNMDIRRQQEELTDDCKNQRSETPPPHTMEIRRQQEELTDDCKKERSETPSSGNTDIRRQQEELTDDCKKERSETPSSGNMDIRRQQEELTDDCKNQRSETPPPHTMDISRQQEELTDDCKKERSETPSSGNMDIRRQQEELTDDCKKERSETPSSGNMDIRRQQEELTEDCKKERSETRSSGNMDIRRQQEELTDDCKNQRSETPPPHTMDISRQQEELTDDCKKERSETPSSGNMDIRRQQEVLPDKCKKRRYETPSSDNMDIHRQREELTDGCKKQRYKTPPPHTMENRRQQDELTEDCKNQRSETPSSRRLQRAVRTTEFLNAVVRLVKHDIGVHPIESFEEKLQSAERILSSFSICSVPVIETHNTHDGRVIKDACSSFHTQCEDTSQIHITFAANYLERPTSNTFTSLATAVCEHVEILSGISRATVVHVPRILELVFNYESVSEYLDRERIKKCPDHREVTPLLHPGSYIPLDKHALLDAGFTPFEKGESVGYEVWDPLDDDQNGYPFIIYAVIIEEIETPFTWNWQRRYKVNIGEATIELPATNLYKLRRKRITVSLDVEIDTGPPTDTLTPPLTENLNETLKAAWEIQEQRKQVIKRLLLTWQADKKVIQYIMMLIGQFNKEHFDKMKKGDDVTGMSRFAEASSQRNTGFYTNVYEKAGTSRQRILELVFHYESVSEYLDKERITKYPDHKKVTPLLPPGTYIPLDKHALLDAGFTLFEKGESVGYEVWDPLHNDQNGYPFIIYAVIIEEIETPITWNWQRRYEVNIGPATTVVSATDLYKLRSKRIIVSLDVEIHTGPPTDTLTPPLTETLNETLKAAWEIQGQRKQVIKRLLLTWQADKKVIQYIMMMIGQFNKEHFDKMKNGDDVTGMSRFAEAWLQRNTGFYTNVYEKAGTSRQSGCSFDSTDGGGYISGPTEGERWLKQAQVDFQSIATDVTPCSVAFKCHQVVEKALKAVLYMKDPNSGNKGHDLHLIACKACPSNSNILDLVNRLLDILDEDCYLKTRYPDFINGPQIPDEVYRRKNTTKACELCEEILKAVEGLVDI